MEWSGLRCSFTNKHIAPIKSFSTLLTDTDIALHITFALPKITMAAHRLLSSMFLHTSIRFAILAAEAIVAGTGAPWITPSPPRYSSNSDFSFSLFFLFWHPGKTSTVRLFRRFHGWGATKTPEKETVWRKEKKKLLEFQHRFLVLTIERGIPKKRKRGRGLSCTQNMKTCRTGMTSSASLLLSI